MSYFYKEPDFTLFKVTAPNGDKWIYNEKHGKPIWRDEIFFEEGDKHTKVVYGFGVRPGMIMDMNSIVMRDILDTFGVSHLKVGKFTALPIFTARYNLPHSDFVFILEDGRVLLVMMTGNNLEIDIDSGDEQILFHYNQTLSEVAEYFGAGNTHDQFYWCLMNEPYECRNPMMYLRIDNKTQERIVRSFKPTKEQVDAYVTAFEEHLGGLK